MRNLKNGDVKLVKGPITYMLSETEELWNKPLDPEIEKLLQLNLSGSDSIPDESDTKIGK